MALAAGGMALHRQLYLVLRDQIDRGALAPGDGLPSEEALGELYEVSRITVRRALQDLSDQGYIVRQPGRGTFVADGSTTPTPSNPQTMKAALRKAQRETTVEVIELAHRTPPARVAQALHLDAGTTATYILRLRTRDDEPLMVTEAWLPMRFAQDLTKRKLDRYALYELLEQTGVVLGRVSQEITAEIADPVQAKLLQVNIGSALLRINRLQHDLDGDPVVHLTIYATPLRSRILTEVAAVDIDTAATGILAHDVSPTRPS